MLEGTQESQAEATVEYETISDEQLEQAIGDEQPSAEPEQVQSEQGEAQVEAEPAEQPKTVEQLQAELDEARRNAEQLQKERDHHLGTVSKHSQELGNLRKMREEIEARLEQNKAQDPAQLFIDNPQQMMDVAADRARLGMERDNIMRQEQELQQNAAVQQNRLAIDRFAPDLQDNMEGITQMLIEEGDSPEAVQNFRQNFDRWPAHTVQNINKLYKANQTINELRAENERLKGRGTEQLQKVEQAAQRQPMTNAATGASATGEGSFPDSMSPSDISRMSDKDLAAALAALGNN